MQTHRSKSKRRSKSLGCEALESRQLLDATGLVWGSSPYLTLSFAPDGTDVSGQSNVLFETFDQVAPRDEWQDAIVSAVHRWTINTNADVGVVADQGQPFGALGASSQDPRFGDIRVGAVRLSPDIAAISISHTEPVAGTWVGDILFNSEYDFATVGDIAAVALHEAGHVLGLDHPEDPTLDPLSVMNIHGNSGNELSTSDKLAIQALYGARTPDLYEERGGNDSFSRAAEIEFEDEDDLPAGYAPAVVYGDLTDASDIDVYELPVGLYSGPVSVRLRTGHLSQVHPKLEVFDADRRLIRELQANADYDGELSYTIPTSADQSEYFLRVSSATTGVNAIGGYVLIATLDDVLTVENAIIDEISDGRYRILDQEVIQEFFEPDGFEPPDFDDEFEEDDEGELEEFANLGTSVRFVTQSTIAAPNDVDNWNIPAPPKEDGTAWVMTVQARTYVPGELIPQLEIQTATGQAVPSTMLVNGGGSVVIQATDVPADEMLFVRVSAADSLGLFQTGNYELTVSFGEKASELALASTGSLSSTTPSNAHTLYVAKDQFIHLALDTTANAASRTSMVTMNVENEAGEVIFRVSSRAGQIRTGPTVSFSPGTYTVRTELVDLIEGNENQVDYQIKSITIDDPLSVPIDNPAGDPLFNCDANVGKFCYPNGGVTNDPLLWTPYVGPPLVTNTPSPGQQTGTFSADWWQWVRETAGNSNNQMQSNQDRYFVNKGEVLHVDITKGLLANDTKTATNAVVLREPTNGQLTVNANGSFVYTPDPGFVGRDSLVYFATDTLSASDLVTVPIHVTPGLPGDANLDGVVNTMDYDVWNQNRYTGPDQNWSQGDFNQDGYVDGSDLHIWLENRFAMQNGPLEGTQTRTPSPAIAETNRPIENNEHRNGRRTAKMSLRRVVENQPEFRVLSKSWSPAFRLSSD